MDVFPVVSSNRWQIEVQSITGDALIAVLAMGQSLALDSGLRQGFVPPPFAQQAEVITTTSQRGLPLGRTVRPQPGRLAINVTDLDDQWMRFHWLPFRSHALVHPFFLLWNPAKYPDEAGICWTEAGTGDNSYTQPGYMDGTLRCRVLSAVAA